MLTKEKHDAVMKKILLDIYSDNLLATNLVFKGGTACYLFHKLDRFSVDIDFNLVDADLTNEVFEKMKKIGARHGKVERPFIKRHTIFLLVNYEKGQQKVKIEISIRSHDKFSEEVKNYFGSSFLVMKRKAMVANKLVALGNRRRFANRDAYDANWFLSNVAEFEVDEKIIEEKTGKKLAEYFEYLADFCEKNIDEKNILQGLGELLTAKKKDWVRKNLKKELIFNLRNWADSRRRTERERSAS